MDNLSHSLRLCREDFWRIGSAPGAGLPFKEWHHFIVLGDGIELLVNLNASASGAGAPGWRVIVIARTREWHGFVDAIASDDVALSPDGCRLRLGASRLTVRDDGYDVTVADGAGRLTATFSFRPRAAPLLARDQAIGGGRRLSWDMYPSGSVRGEATVGGATFHFDDVAGYHDHNWGSFAWGDDFTWEWGMVLPDAPRQHGDAVVLSSLQNRARTVASLEQVFWWHDGRNVLAVSGPELSITARGAPPSEPAWRIPKVMSVLRGQGDADLPGELVMRALVARGGPLGGAPLALDPRAIGRAELTVTFTTEHVAELLLPAESDPLGVITIYECVGRAHVAGRLERGPTIEWEGRGVFELVRS